MSNERNPLFAQLPVELSENLRSINPWWAGKPATPLPAFRRWPFGRLKHLLTAGMTQATVLRGPRRVGKTVLLRQIIEALLEAGTSARRMLYAPFDELPTLAGIKEPVLTIARWFEGEILGCTFNEAAKQKEPAFLFLDEVQNLEAWAPQIKNLVDNHAVRVLVTGSSSLRIEAGRDSLAGRITTLDLGPLLRLGRGEDLTGGRTRESILATTLEALLGVIYLEDGLDAVRGVVARLGGGPSRG